LQVSRDLAEGLVPFSAKEMTQSAEVMADVQGPASQILTLLSVPYCNLVVDELLRIFTPGVLPHYYIINTFANVASANGSKTSALCFCSPLLLQVSNSACGCAMCWVVSRPCWALSRSRTSNGSSLPVR
jgi:hypothetical protein